MSVQFSYSNPHPGHQQASRSQMSKFDVCSSKISDQSMTDRILEEKTVCYCASFDLEAEQWHPVHQKLELFKQGLPYSLGMPSFHHDIDFRPWLAHSVRYPSWIQCDACQPRKFHIRRHNKQPAVKAVVVHVRRLFFALLCWWTEKFRNFRFGLVESMPDPGLSIHRLQRSEAASRSSV